MTKQFDITIVGASFAGLVCARTAAMRGLKTAVIEAKPDPGAHVHTTGIMVKEAVDDIDLPHHLTKRIHGVRLYAPNLKSVDLFAPGHYFLTTDTSGVLRWLASEAERAGVQMFCGTRFEDAERRDGKIRLKTPDISTRFLVGADGARSRVAAKFDLDQNRKFLTGLEVEYDALENVDPGYLHCFVNSDLAPGYIGWAASGPKVTQIGLAVGHGHSPDINRFLDHTDRLFSLGMGQIVERRSGLIPCGGALKNFYGDGVILIGDAAGLVSPMTGGGIRLAFRSGRRTAQAISDYLLDLGPEPGAILAREMPNFCAKKILRNALDLAPPSWMINAGLTLPFMQTMARRVYFHRRGGTVLGFKDFQEQRLTRREI
jgi:digeranylgeranylglycerophospholipid reductase